VSLQQRFNTAIEQLLEVVFCVVRAATIATQQYGEHTSAATVKLQQKRRAVFSVWSLPRCYQWDEVQRSDGWKGAAIQRRLSTEVEE
jgi:hypothetical protein